MSQRSIIAYNPSTLSINIRDIGMSVNPHIIEHQTMKKMASEASVMEHLMTHPFLSKIEWNRNNIYLAGGYVSRLLCNDPLESSDLDLFMYNRYSRDDIALLLALIKDVYSTVKWYYAGSVIIAQTKTIQIQIICTNHRSRAEVLDAFDASYVQCGWDGYEVGVFDAFNKYTPSGLAKVTRPTVSLHRESKAQKRGFILTVLHNQYITWVVKNPINIAYMKSVECVVALREVVIHGDFNPHLETSYQLLSNTSGTYEKCSVTLEIVEGGYSNLLLVKENGIELISTSIYTRARNDLIIAINDDTLVSLDTLDTKKVYSAYKLMTSDNYCTHLRIIVNDTL